MRYLKLIFLILSCVVSVNVQSETTKNDFTDKLFEHRKFPNLMFENDHHLDAIKSSRLLGRRFCQKQYVLKGSRCREMEIFDTSAYISSSKNLNNNNIK